ncbi:RDD family protein [Streptomyces sp. NBC_01186]|uniref:RDD family protein n=1 Tax=Streptomyces sp. NBC_01186 TaxID=2903765 RepID=UPI002E111BB4|nr:RDD family protein [Streptomyces sp. NBC_01186]
MGPSGANGEVPRSGYYPDPSIPGYIRYWNGSSWVPGTSRPEPREGEPMPAPPPVASSPSSPSTPAKSGGPATPPRRDTSDETGPVFLDEEDGGDGRSGGEAAQGGDEESGQRPAGANDGAGALPELPSRTSEPASAPTWQADPARQAGFGPPASGDPRGDWGNDTPADPPSAQGGREHTVGLRRSEVLRDLGPAGPVPAQGSPTSPSPGGQAQPGQRVPGQGRHGAGAGPEQGSGQRVPGQGQPGQSQLGSGSGPAQGSPASASPVQGPVQGPAQGTGQAPPGQLAPGHGQAGASGGPPQGSPLPAAGPGHGAPALSPAQASPAQAPSSPPSSPPSSLPAAAPGPAPDGGLQSAQPSWSQQGVVGAGQQPPAAGLPAQAHSGGPDAVVPWRPPANDPFAQMAVQQARPAGLGKRFGARLVDLVLTLAVGGGVAFPFVSKVTDHIDAKVDAVEQAGETKKVWLLDGTTGGYLALVVGALLVFGILYEVLPTARWGRTLGKKLFGLSVADIESHDKPGFGKAFLRWLVYGVLGVLVIGVVNLAWCLFDRPWRQCWHDKVAGTFVAKRGAGGSGL